MRSRTGRNGASMKESSADVSRQLARFLVASTPGDLPARVVHEAKRSLLNFFGCALGGCRDEAMEHASAVMLPLAGPPAATVIGRPERTDILTAAFLNAAAGNVFDFDDTHIPTIIHPTAPVAPVVLALAETRPVSGRDLLHALVLGIGVECRLGNAVSPEHYRRGWHITSTCGVFGAATAAGKLLGLDAKRMVWALGSAAAQSSGLIETLGHMAKSVGVGQSARGGLLAALLAQQGLAGPDRPLEGPRGFAYVMGDGPDFGALLNALSSRWEILANTYKPYPCGVVLNPVIDACLALAQENKIAAERIARITVAGHSLLRERTDRPAVTTGREAQVSAQHSVAVALLQRAAGIQQFSDAVVKDPAVLALREKVTVIEDASIPVSAAVLTITFSDGGVLTKRVDEARGSLDRPLTDAEIEAKVVDLVAYGAPGVDARRLIDAVWSLEESRNAGELMRLARPAN